MRRRISSLTWGVLVPAAGLLMLTLATVSIGTPYEPLFGGIAYLGVGLLLAVLTFVTTPWGKARWLAPLAVGLMILGLMLLRGRTALFHNSWRWGSASCT